MATGGGRDASRFRRMLRRDRSAGQAAVGLVIAVGAVSAAVGVGVPVAVTHMRQVTAWLESSDGTVTRVDGLSGRADARVSLTDSAGHKLRVVQDGATVLVEDDTTGTVTRIDPAQLSVTQSASFGTAGDKVVTGQGLTYLVDLGSGTVQRIDPMRLTVLGSPVDVSGGQAAGMPGIDSAGTLWVPIPARGTAVPVSVDAGGQATAAAPVNVGSPGDVLTVSLVGGAAAVTDSTAGLVTIAPPHASVLRVALPGGITAAAPGLLVPAATDGPVLPILDARAGQLAMVDVTTGAPSAVGLGTLAGDDLGPPVEHDGRVYLPDQSTGSLDVYDEHSGRMLAPIPVTGKPGALEVFAKDGILWANAPDGSDALTVDANGVAHKVGKYVPELPGASSTASSSAAAPNAPTGNPDTGRSSAKPGKNTGTTAPTPTGTGPVVPTTPVVVPPTSATSVATATSSTARTTSPTSPTTKPTTSTTSPASPPTSTSSTPAPPPQPPGSPRAAANAGWIDVTFSPSAGGTPTGYTLTAPAGATVSPTKVPAGGPFAFKVTGLPCAAQQYGFTVNAVYAGGSVPSQPTAQVRPCFAPGTPGTPKFGAAVEHALNVSWTPPASTGGAAVSYVVSWTGAKSGSSPTLTGTTYQITNLANFQNYAVSVTASNAAGSSTPPASASTALNGPQYASNIYNNRLYQTNLRQGPGQSTASLGLFPTTPPGQLGTPLTVLCQVTGQTYTDPTNPTTYNIWDKVNAMGGKIGYVADLYVHTPASAAGNYWTFSDPPIWNCN